MDKNLTILIADDNAVIRLSLKKILEKNNYTVIEAENGKSALYLIEKHIPDLVLLDLMMPVMDGESTLKKIRSNFKYSRYFSLGIPHKFTLIKSKKKVVKSKKIKFHFTARILNKNMKCK